MDRSSLLTLKLQWGSSEITMGTIAVGDGRGTGNDFRDARFARRPAAIRRREGRYGG